MTDKDNNEKLIGKLIKKRKAENDAFLKLLKAMEDVSSTNAQTPVGKKSRSKNA